MTTSGALLCEFLEELSLEELQEFQCRLPDWKGVGKEDDVLSVVKFMTKKFGPDEAVSITISTLRGIEQDQLASQLHALLHETGRANSETVDRKDGNDKQEKIEKFKPERQLRSTPPSLSQKCVSFATDNAQTFQPTISLQDNRMGVHSLDHIDRPFYRHSCPSAGVFSCCLTGLLFKMERAGVLEYWTKSWGQRDLGRLVPAGPLYGITCEDGALSQLGLPHCDADGANSQSLSVIHLRQNGEMEKPEPQEITECHLFVNISSCSDFGIVANVPEAPVRALVVLSRQATTLNVRLLPGNVPLHEVKEHLLRGPQMEVFLEPVYHCMLTPGEMYTLMVKSDRAQDSFSEETLFSLMYDNDHPAFMVPLSNTEDVQLSLKLTATAEPIWSCHVKLPKYDESSTYQINNINRDECVIINNVRYINNKRTGSDLDADGLWKLFNWLGFRVTMFEDLSAAEMRDRLAYVRDRAQADCFVLCVLSHGCQEGVLGVDGELVTIHDINTLFSGPSCPALLNKPKVFFFQACRGSKRDIPAQVAETSDEQVDAVPVVPLERRTISTPAYSDILNCLSTVQDYVSIRCKKTGSWFIQSVCKQLREGCTKNLDILTILTKVNMEVSQKEARLGKSPVKQTPEQRHTLRKSLYLRSPPFQ